MSRRLCNDAINGRLCIDDLCRTGGETLCGFDRDDYLDITAEAEDFYHQEAEPEEDEGHP